MEQEFKITVENGQQRQLKKDFIFEIYFDMIDSGKCKAIIQSKSKLIDLASKVKLDELPYYFWQ